MKSLGAGAALGPLVLVGMVGVPSPASAAEGCHGQAATIVGERPSVVAGTEGDGEAS